MKIEKNRISWASIFAGLLLGVVMFIATLQLGALFTTILPLSFLGTSISAIIWLLISLLSSAYIAGMFCMLVQQTDEKFVTVESTPEEIETTIHRFRKNSKIHGIIVGAAIIVVTTYMSATGIASTISGLSSVLSTTAKTTAVATAGTIAGVSSIDEVQNYIKNISRDDVEKLLAKEIPTLNETQVSAVLDTVEYEFEKASNYLNNSAVYDLPENATKTYNYIKYVFVDDNSIFMRKLQNQGLTQQESAQVVNVINKYVNEIGVKIEELKKTAIETTKKTIIYTTITWLLTSVLVFVFAILGAYSMRHTEEKTTYQKDKKEEKIVV